MILTFKEQFVDKIKSGQKVTTISKAGRWKVGDKIHFWKDNPRNVKQNPYSFGVGKVKTVIPLPSIKFAKNIHFDKMTISKNMLQFYDKHDREFFFEGMADLEGFENYEELRNWFRETYKDKIANKGNLILENMEIIHFDFIG